MNHTNKSVYFGNWVNGKKKGEGIQKWIDGNEYKGKFEDD